MTSAVSDAPAGPPSPPVRPTIAALLEALDALALDPGRGDLADGAALLVAAERLSGLALRDVAAVDRAATYRDAGHGTAATWARCVLGTSDVAARATVRLAGRLDGDLQPLGELLVAGGTTVAHARAVQAGVRGVSPQVLAESMPAICAATQLLDPGSLARELRERALAVSPQLAREQEKRQQARHGLWLDELWDGCFAPKGVLTPEVGQIVQAALDAIVHGDRTAGDQRDAPQRRADALAQLASHALDCEAADPAGLPERAGTRAQIHVLVHAERLAGPASAPSSTTLDPCGADARGSAAPPAATYPGSHALLGDGTLLRLTCDADISRVVLDPAGIVIDLGRLTRTVTPAQWRALVARDQHCVIRGCARRAAQCQAHHVRHWARGGASDLSNYALVCHTHHHEIHDSERWLQHADGRWLTPDGYLDSPDPP